MSPRRVVLRTLGLVGAAMAASFLMADAASPARQPSVRGVIVDAAGAGIPEVLVELVGPTGTISSTRTDLVGRFGFPLVAPAGPINLQARRIGYRALSRRLVVSDSEIRYPMEAIPTSLAAITVIAVERACPNTEQPAARAIWQRAAAHYSGIAGRGTYRRETRWDGSVRPDSVGVVDESRLKPSAVVELGLPFRSIDKYVLSEGYAKRLDRSRSGTYPGGTYVFWQYPRLETIEAGHFADRLFGELHTFSMVTSSGPGFRIAYCTRDKKLPYLEGTLDVAADTTFLSSSWRIQTPEPREGAGGEVLFAPPGDGPPVMPYLLASRGVFWRSINSGRRFFQTVESDMQWTISADSTMPR